jgi:hypothetical protein
VFANIGYPIQVSQGQAAQVTRLIDRNDDGKVNKMELFNAIKNISANRRLHGSGQSTYENYYRQAKQQQLYGQSSIQGSQRGYTQYGYGSAYGW